MITVDDIEAAARRIDPAILCTPLLHSRWLSRHCGGEVYLKLESEQQTGSFKARGSMNKVAWLVENGIEKLPVTASTGNHGLGFARALDIKGIKGKVFLPENAAATKVEAIRQYEAELEFYGDDPYTTERYAREQAEKNDWVYVSPYNDPQVIAGQGTIAREITRQVDHCDNMLVTVGGGGLISGIGLWLESRWPDTKLIGCQPARSPEMAASVRAGSYQEVESEPTLSDGSAGGFERDSITFDLCRRLVDDFILVEESAIAGAVRAMIRRHSKLVEGAAGVAVASLLDHPERFRGQTTVIVICGANISVDKLSEILQ